MDIKYMELPLVFFTVMSQWGIGAILALTIYQMNASKENILSGGVLRRAVLAIWLIEVIGSSMSMGHLGVPLEAYRSILGLSHSWLSREAVTFILLNGLVTLWALSCWVSPQVNVRNQLLGWLSALGGMAAIFVTAQVYYQMVAHPLWHTPATQIAFIGSAIVLGFSLVALFVIGQGKPLLSIIKVGVLIGVMLVLAAQIIRLQLPASQGGSYLLWWQVVMSMLLPCIVAMKAYKERPSVMVMVLVMLAIFSGELAGRALFYGSVMIQAPWF
ncbi:dimethyl sulfoxide reductase anchor subunit family protein [Providencia huaxiensis]|uniref:dimethyl sulfoxide reductase anchor subunit family protein n=1 Tax=Providencia TaxID=586 RepID=UPI000EE4DB25|nr:MULTISPECIES: DmsC/YnfH family molybdoenzyme membrane anchor subunit [Providencia]HCI95915.1 dimethylsulfoxide reductase [Providencia sp.]ELR5056462.1 dimethyl sulfoxide reductase anchor subunit [Providencia rettgeri]ELR5085600.1 dimethyl sulfoxide reductase anchor subunit [Providencia rettgeri]ELR5106913.1 dimethyl sulfoxide reductase anchor subunit [Providencia rettgeri]ELR5282836.1 dimethyl sulfoxide reductase anchor subunit [Providencia rettgeri]